MFITRQQAAELIGVSERTLYRAEQAGTLKPFRPTPRVIRYTPEIIEAFSRAHCPKPKTERG